MQSIIGRILLGKWELGGTTTQDVARFTATASPKCSISTSGGTPVRTFIGILGWLIGGRIELGQTRPDLAGLAGIRGQGTFVATAAPTADFTGTVYNIGAFEATADPLCTFNRGGAFVGTADARAAFAGSTAPVVKAFFTAAPL